VLPVDKPAGPTSHDAVAIARRALGTRRVGHTGTLDPFASGLLLLCVGPATRVAEYLSGLPKTYQAVLRLGEQTDTDDRTGTVIAASDVWRTLSRQQVAEALERRGGRQWQVPPGYSAKKVAGERSYQRARRGESLTPGPVQVTVESIRLTSWDPPFAGFETTCSTGTYVRAIARDVGIDLGACAHLVELRRSAIGPHSVSTAIPLQVLQESAFQGRLLSALEALSHLPRLDVDDVSATAIGHGRAIPVPAGFNAAAAMVVWQGTLLAIGAARDGRLQPAKVFDA